MRYRCAVTRNLKRLKFLLALCAGAFGAPTVLAQSESDWVVVSSLSLVSDYVHRGLSLSSGNPAAQIGIGARHTKGLYANLWLSTLDTRDLAPDFGGIGHEISALVGWSDAINDLWSYEVTGSWYQTLATSQILNYDHTEFSASLLYRDAVRLSAAYAPRGVDHARDDGKLRGPRRVIEAAGQYALRADTALTGGIGYADLTHVSDVDYLYWSVGLTKRIRRVTGSIAIIGTDHNARDRFIDDRASTRIVASIIFQLSPR
ncbi:MAG: TorF family putative porin [Pseudomonadota bacterium]